LAETPEGNGDFGGFRGCFTVGSAWGEEEDEEVGVKPAELKANYE